MFSLDGLVPNQFVCSLIRRFTCTDDQVRVQSHFFKKALDKRERSDF